MPTRSVECSPVVSFVLVLELCLGVDDLGCLVGLESDASVAGAWVLPDEAEAVADS